MTRDEIFWGLALNFIVLIVGAVMGPLLKRLWQRINRPAPLSPQDKGNLAKQIATNELGLVRLVHFRNHPNDILIYFFQLGASAILFAILAICSYTWVPTSRTLLAPCLALPSAAFCVISIVEGGRLSERKLDAGIERLDTLIVEDNTKLKLG